MRLILASQSPARRSMLTAAGIEHDAVSPGVDESAAKAALAGAGLAPRDLADALAELKAVKLSQRHPDALVLGCDSVVALDDGNLLDKPATRDEAGVQLAMMSGRRHDLFSAAVVAEHGRAVWRHVDRATLHMRPLSAGFIASYLDREWPEISGCVGCYRIEGPGIQLFARIEGSHFTIIGLPLLPVLDYLRTRHVLAS